MPSAVWRALGGTQIVATQAPVPHRFDLFDADEDGLAVAALRGFVDLLDGVTGEVVVAYGALHDALQYCERADDRGSAGACLLEVGRKSARRRSDGVASRSDRRGAAGCAGRDRLSGSPVSRGQGAVRRSSATTRRVRTRPA